MLEEYLWEAWAWVLGSWEEPHRIRFSWRFAGLCAKDFMLEKLAEVSQANFESHQVDARRRLRPKRKIAQNPSALEPSSPSYQLRASR